MHWDDVHLYVFDVNGLEYGPEPDQEEISLHWAGDDRRITVGKALQLGGGRFEYTYDFGAEQRVVIEVTPERASGPARLQCLDGEGGDFEAGAVNRRLAEEFQTMRAGLTAETAEEQLAADLTLVLLLLMSYEQGKGTRVANKTLRLDTLDALSDAGLVVTNPYRKAVQLTERGVERAEQLLERISGLLQPRREERA